MTLAALAQLLSTHTALSCCIHLSQPWFPLLQNANEADSCLAGWCSWLWRWLPSKAAPGQPRCLFPETCPDPLRPFTHGVSFSSQSSVSRMVYRGPTKLLLTGSSRNGFLVLKHRFFSMGLSILTAAQKCGHSHCAFPGGNSSSVSPNSGSCPGWSALAQGRHLPRHAEVLPGSGQ